MTEIVSPFQQFFDTSGKPLSNGVIYIGTANLDAQSNPISVYWDAALTIPAPQPIRTLNGYPVWNGAPARLYANVTEYSITVRNAQNKLMYSTTTVQPAPPFISVKDFGALGDGSDATTAINAANAYAISIGAELHFPPGKYVYSGQTDVQKVTWVGPGISRRNVADYLEAGGAVICLTGTTQSPFIMRDGGGATFRGLGFFWPGQTGVSVTPVVYPAMITGYSGEQIVDLTIDNCFIINAYDVLDTGPASKIGAIRFINSKIYAIRSLVRFMTGAPEVVRVDGCDITPGQFQNVAVFANSGNLRKWTGANGDLFYMDCGASPSWQSVDGMQVVNNLIFGYRRVFNGVSGRFDLPTCTGNLIDACGTVVKLSGSAGMPGAKFDNVYYFYQNDSSGAATIGFDIETTGIVRGDFAGTCPYAAGSLARFNGPNIDTITFRVNLYAWGQGALQTGDAYGFYTNSKGTFHISGSFRGQTYPDSVGVFFADAKAATITAAFDSTKVPILIDTTFTGSWVAAGVVTTNTSSGNAIDCRAANTGQALACILDKPPTGTTPKFGTFTSNADAPITGYVTIRDEVTGTIRKLATIA